MRGPPPSASLRWLMSSCRRPAHSPERSFCANAGLTTRRMRTTRNEKRLTLDGTSIHVNPSDVYEASPAMTAARHQIGEADLVDLAQIRILHPASRFRRLLTFGVHGRDGRDVELQ